MEKLTTIASYSKYFRNSDPDYDFRDTIEEIYEWYFDKMVEREEYRRKTGAFNPVDLSEMPGRELGFRPIEVVYTQTTTFCAFFSNKVAKGINPIPDGGRLPAEAEIELGFDSNMQYYCHQSANYYRASKTGSWPIAYNRDFGSIYYAPIKGWEGSLGDGFFYYDDLDSASMIRIQKINGNSCFLYDAEYDEMYSSKLMAHIVKAVPQYINFVGSRSCAIEYDRINDELKVYLCTPRHCEPWLKYPLNLVEHMYGFEENILDQILGDIKETFADSLKPGDISFAQKVLGTLFQSVIQTYPACKWFAPFLIESASKFPYYGNVSSLQQLLGVDKPTLRLILSEPTYHKFVFWLILRSYQECSYIKAVETYDRIMKKDKELMVNEKSFDEVFGRCNIYNHVAFNTPRGAMIRMPNVPMVWAFYVRHNLFSNYSISQFYKWLLNECYNYVKNKEYSRDDFILGEVFNDLRDYNRMAEEMNRDKEWSLPSNLIKAHELMIENFNEFSAIHSVKTSITASIKKLVPLYRGKRGNVIEDDAYTMTQPMSLDDIFNEGIRLHHCVGSYYKDILEAKGSMLLYFMRKKDRAEEPLVTVQVNQKSDGTYFITEAAGIENRRVTAEEQDYLNRWIVAFNENVTRLLSKKKITPEQCFDDFAVWCQWGNLQTEELYKYIEKFDKLEWDKALTNVFATCSKALPFCPKAGLARGNEKFEDLMIASMYGLCCQQTMKYTPFKEACKKTSE